MNIDIAMKEAMSISGAVGVALVDYDSGMSLGTSGGGDWLNLEVAAAGNTEVVRSKLRVMQTLGLSDTIEDILITLHRQYHLIRLMGGLKSRGSLFLYLVLERDSSNLALARHHLKRIESELQISSTAKRKGVGAGSDTLSPHFRQCTRTGPASRDTATCRSTKTASPKATATSTAEIQNARWKPEVNASSRPTPDASSDDV
jgi:hypothetical protein